jgi:hypothetical protein
MAPDTRHRLVVALGEHYHGLMIDPASPSQEGFCTKCRYPLRGLPEPRCPECGKPFDPANPETFFVTGQRPMGPIAKRLFHPPGRVFLIACAVSASFALLSGTCPGLIIPLALVSGFSFPFLITIWAVRLVLSLAVGAWYRPTAGSTKSVIVWVLPPTLFALAGILYALNVPLYLGFVLNKPFLERLQARASDSPGPTLRVSRVGFYPVRQVLKIGNGVRIWVSGADGGFGCFPQGPPTGSIEIVYEPWWGDWYLWWHAGLRRIDPFLPPDFNRPRDG